MLDSPVQHDYKLRVRQGTLHQKPNTPSYYVISLPWGFASSPGKPAVVRSNQRYLPVHAVSPVWIERKRDAQNNSNDNSNELEVARIVPVVTETNMQLKIADATPIQDIHQVIGAHDVGQLSQGYETATLDVICRQYKIADFTWSQSSPVGTVLWSNTNKYTFQSLPGVKQRLLRYKWIRYDIEYELRMNSTQFHAGALLIASAPGLGGYMNASFTGGRTDLANWNPIIASASTSEGLRWTIPYVSQKDMVEINPLTNAIDEELGGSSLNVIVQLEDATGALTPVACTVWARLVNVTLSGQVPWTYTSGVSKTKTLLRSPKFRGSGKTVESEGAQKQEQGTLTTISSAGQTIAGALESIPVVGDFAKAAGAVLKQTTSIFSALGLDKPTQTTIPTFTFPKNHPDTVYGLGLDSSVKFSLDPEAILSEIDEDMRVTTLQQIYMKPSYLGQWRFTSATDKNTQFLVIPLVPDRFNYLGQQVVPFWSIVARRFAYWRGSMDLCFKFITNRFSTARLRFTQIPCAKDAGTQVPDINTIELSDAPSFMLDIKGDTEFNLSLPYYSDRPYWALQQSIGVNNNAKNIGPLTGVSTRAGIDTTAPSYLIVSIENSLSVPSSTEDVGCTMLTWGRLGADTQFSNYVGPRSLIRWTSMETQFSRPFNSLPGAKVAREQHLIAPEEYNSINLLLHRYGQTMARVVKGNNTIIHCPVDTLSSNSRDELNYFSSFFKYWRGSIRYKWFPTTVDYDSGTLRAASTSFTDRTGNTPWTQGTEGWIPPGDHSPGITAEIPWYSNCAYQPVNMALQANENELGDTNSISRGLNWELNLAPRVPASYVSLGLAKASRAAGEDFALFLLVPPWTDNFPTQDVAPTLEVHNPKAPVPQSELEEQDPPESKTEDSSSSVSWFTKVKSRSRVI